MSTPRRMMTQRLDPRSDRPLALQLADLLRAEIQEGQRRPGSQLPTESEFQAAYGVSRTTIRAALATLAGEGLVLTRKGYGSYVRDRQPLRRGVSPHRPAPPRGPGEPGVRTQALRPGPGAPPAGAGGWPGPAPPPPPRAAGPR